VVFFCRVTMEKASNLFLLAFVLLMISALGCLPAVKKTEQTPEEALQEVRFLLLEFRDDMDRESLILAVRRNLEYLNRISSETLFHYGPHEFTCGQVRESQEAFLSLLSQGLDPAQLNREMANEFRVYRATGSAGDGRVLFTGYYEPVYEGSLSPDDTFRYPLYRPPTIW